MEIFNFREGVGDWLRTGGNNNAQECNLFYLDNIDRGHKAF